MRIVAVMAFLLSTTLAAPAAPPPTTVEVLQQFGLFGSWAVDCGRPASPQNPYVSDILQGADTVVEEHHLGPNYAVNRYQVLSATRLSATEVALEVIFQPGSEAARRQKLIMQVRAERRRTLFNQPEGGDVRVRNGIALAAGVKTPMLRKCH